MAVPAARQRRARRERIVDRDGAWRLLVEALVADLDLVAVETTTRVFAELLGYRRLSPERVLDGIRSTFRAGHRGLLERRPPGEEEQLPHAQRCGRTAAIEGVPVDELLHAYRIALDVLRERIRADAPSGPHRDAVVLEALDIAIAWNSSGMVSAASAHREAELEIVRTEEEQTAAFVRQLLLGSSGRTDRRAHLELHGIDPDRSYHVVCARPLDGKGTSEIRRHLRLDDGDAGIHGVVALLEGDVVGLLSDLPRDTLPVAVGASPLTSIDHLAEAFPLALRALETASATGIGGVYEFGSLGLAPAVLSDADVGEILAAKYVAPLERLGRSGQVILDTVDAYLSHDRVLRGTARALGVHPNTIRYRVGRFESVTDASLRRTADLVETWWALRRRSLTRGSIVTEHKEQPPAFGALGRTARNSSDVPLASLTNMETCAS
jgi:PucR-like helix-turn-helix protein